MNDQFVQEIIDEDRPPRIVGCLTGWEEIVFEIEDADEEGSPSC